MWGRRRALPRKLALRAQRVLWVPHAPDIIAAILDEILPPGVTLFDLAARTPDVWEEQRGKPEDQLTGYT